MMGQQPHPSIDLEVLLRLLLVGYLYGITSERRLMEEVRMHLAFAGLVGWDSSAKFLTIPLSLRTVMADSAVWMSSEHGLRSLKDPPTHENA